MLTDFGGRWQGDAIVVPRTVELAVVWSALVEESERAQAPGLHVLARKDDSILLALLEASGFTASDERSGITWMNASDCPTTVPVPEAYCVVDRSSHADAPQPMAARNGDEVETRLRQCSLYDPDLDLTVYARSGEPAAYALFWFDDVTRVGMLEPMRVEETHQSPGLARAVLTVGLNRLVGRAPSA